MLLQQGLRQDLASVPLSPKAPESGDYDPPYPTEFADQIEQDDTAPSIAVFVIPSVFVVLALLFVAAMNNRTLTILARDRAGSTPPVNTEAPPAAFQKPPEPPTPRINLPKVCRIYRVSCAL